MTNESLLDHKLCEHTENRETVNYIWPNNRDGGLVDIFQLPPDSREMHTPFSTVYNTVRPAAQLYINIARGTTDPEIDSVTWIKLSNNMDLLHLLQIWPPDGATSNS